MTGPARHHLGLTVVLLVLTTLATLAGGALAAEEEVDVATVVGDRSAGEQLFLRDCAVCHGPQGAGTANGPPITQEGTASIDFSMRTGRMPIPTSDTEVRRDVARRADGSRIVYDEQELADVAAYATEWTEGPPIPELGEVADERGVAAGGELWRLECAVCHQLAGRGGVLLDDAEIPTVLDSTALEIAEATRVGPYSMPGFGPRTISDEELDQVVAYVTRELQQPEDPGGWGAARLGPFAEGAVVWVFGVVTLLLAAAWVGRRT